jgi:hypothetical protein
MDISILCDSPNHPILPYLFRWQADRSDHNVRIHNRMNQLTGGDILFLISCNTIIKQETQSLYRHVLVIHASDLPLGRGWSPHIWQILAGNTDITVSLLEAAEKVDSGRIWCKQTCHIPKTALFDEINRILFQTEIDIMSYALDSYHSITPQPQDMSIAPTYYPKRTPEDSRLDINQSLRSLFDQIRVADPHRYPAFFYLDGQKFTLTLGKVSDNTE